MAKRLPPIIKSKKHARVLIDGVPYSHAELRALARVNLEHAGEIDENGEYAPMTEAQKREAANREEFTRDA